MNLSSRLNQALEKRDLQPVIYTPIVEYVTPSPKRKSMCSTLKEGIKAANSTEPDEFGTRIVLVKKLPSSTIQLPMTMGKFIVDDIQKIAGGGYEVHLIENNQK